MQYNLIWDLRYTVEDPSTLGTQWKLLHVSWLSAWMDFWIFASCKRNQNCLKERFANCFWVLQIFMSSFLFTKRIVLKHYIFIFVFRRKKSDISVNFNKAARQISQLKRFHLPSLSGTIRFRWKDLRWAKSYLEKNVVFLISNKTKIHTDCSFLLPCWGSESESNVNSGRSVTVTGETRGEGRRLPWVPTAGTRPSSSLLTDSMHLKGVISTWVSILPC